ncbi:MAG TPA: GAF domain-containing protein, partial [Chloroflexi bacterium]|nr:GAF domain-containing protein [Chloroflexota bacterium]
MATSTDLKARIAELEEKQMQVVALSQMSRDLSGAQDENDLLQVLVWPTIDTDASTVTLVYIDLDANGDPVWAKVAAHWQREGALDIPVGTRYYLPEFPLTQLWLADPGEPQLVADVTVDERLDQEGREMLVRLGIRALAVIPMSQAGHWVGLALLGWESPRSFGAQETEVYHMLSGLACPVVKSLRLTHEARVRLHELSVLNELGQILTTRLKVMEVLEEAFRQASRLIDANNFYVALYHRDKNEIFLIIDVVDGHVTKPYATWRNRGGFIEHVIRRRVPVIAQDTYADWMAERQRGVYKRISLTQLGVRVPLSVLGVPLIVGDEVLGMMAVRDYDNPRAYDEHSLELMTSIASPVAIALQNAQLFDNLERMVAERTAELQASVEEQTRLQQQVIEAQRQALQELSTPIIP